MKLFGRFGARTEIEKDIERIESKAELRSKASHVLRDTADDFITDAGNFMAVNDMLGDKFYAAVPMFKKYGRRLKTVTDLIEKDTELNDERNERFEEYLKKLTEASERMAKATEKQNEAIEKVAKAIEKLEKK